MLFGTRVLRMAFEGGRKWREKWRAMRGGRRDECSGGKQNITKGFRDVLINVYLCIDKIVFHSTI